MKLGSNIEQIRKSKKLHKGPDLNPTRVQPYWAELRTLKIVLELFTSPPQVFIQKPLKFGPRLMCNLRLSFRFSLCVMLAWSWQALNLAAIFTFFKGLYLSQALLDWNGPNRVCVYPCELEVMHMKAVFEEMTLWRPLKNFVLKNQN